MTRQRVFHFDIKTYGNYGDTLLFEAVRQCFEGFADGDCFEIVDTRPLRDPVRPRLVDWINASADVVVVGGGGLFLPKADAVADSRSGWQWNISLEQLRRIEVPIVLFAVGNNRFYGQEDFPDPFREHLNTTLDQSVFAGLRNHGSIESVRGYVEHDPDRIGYQPCPTTLSSVLFPDLYSEKLENTKTIGVQSIIGRRQLAVGFDRDAIDRIQVDVLRRLVGEGWSVVGLPHARADMRFHTLLAEEGLLSEERMLWGERRLFHGVEAFADLPIMLGTRGHAQMVPFGMGAIPLALDVHPKNRYFATDLGHPEWAVDPRADDAAETLYRLVQEVHERQPELREELAGRRQAMYETTLGNLSGIYQRLGGELVAEPTITPLTPAGRRQASQLYHESMERNRIESELADRTAQLQRAETELGSARAAVEEMASSDTYHATWLVQRAEAVERAGDRDRGRHLRRAAEMLRDPQAPATTPGRALRRARRLAQRGQAEHTA